MKEPNEALAPEAPPGTPEANLSGPAKPEKSPLLREVRSLAVRLVVFAAVLWVLLTQVYLVTQVRNIRWQKMALRAANGLLDGVTALLVLLAVVWSGYALWDNSRVYAAADNVQAGLLAFKPQPQEDNSLSFGQLRDINPDVCGWLTLDGTAIDYPVVQGESNFTYLNTDVYGSFALAGSIFLDVDCDADFSGRYSLLYGHHMENGRMFGDLDKYKDGAFFRQNTTGTLTLPGGSYRLEVLACLVVPASEQAIFAPGKWRSDAGGLLPFVEENALQMDAQALRALEKEPEGAQFLAMATCSGEYTDARTVVLARMEPMSDLQNGKEESLS